MSERNEKIIFSAKYVAYFIAIDLAVFFFLYFVHNTFFIGLSIADSVLKAVYEMIWRMFYGQLVLQCLCLTALRYLNLQHHLVLILLCAALTFIIAGLISFSDIAAVVKLFFFPTKQGMGEAFVLLITTACAWVVLEARPRESRKLEAN